MIEKYLNKITCIDCLEGMKNLPDRSIDLTLADPPYNAKNIGPQKRTYKSGIMQLPAKEYRKFCENWFKEARRISKKIVLTPGIANTHNYPQPFWVMCWHKPASCSFNRFGGYNAWEPVFLYGKRVKGQRLPQDYILCNTTNAKKGFEKNHPARNHYP